LGGRGEVTGEEGVELTYLPYPFTQLKPWMEADNALNRNFVLIDYFYRKKKIMYSIRE
jgi:hypothetical protein